MDGTSINATSAPARIEGRLSKLEDRVTCLEAQGAKVEERTELILESLRRIEDRVYQDHGEVRGQGSALGEHHRSRGELIKTITLIFTALAALIGAAGVVFRNF